MNNKAPHISYNHTDIEKYLNGKMSNAEMYALEMAAIKDPFLADAIEGYSSANNETTKKHLSEIELKLLGERHPAKVVSIVKNNNKNYFKIAASIVGIGLAGTIGFLLTKNNDKENNIAVLDTTEKVATKTDTITSLINNPSTTTINKKNEVEVRSKIENTSSNNVVNNTQQEFKKLSHADGDGVVDKLDAEQSKIVEPIAAIAQANDDSKKEFRLDTITTNSNVISNVIQNNSFNQNAIASNKPRKGYSVETNYNGNSNTQQQVINLNNIQLKKDKNYKEPETTAITTINKKAKPEIKFKLSKEDSMAVPQNGWAAFNEYLRTNTAEVVYMDTTNNNYTAINSKTGQIVELEFEIDEKGHAQNINVANGIKSIGDSTAISLLKNGPKWTNGVQYKSNLLKEKQSSKQKGKVKIKINN